MIKACIFDLDGTLANTLAPANIIPHFVEKANRKIKNVINDYFLLFAGHRLN